MAANDIMEQYPGAVLRVVDSRCASMGQGLLLHYAVTRKEEGATLEELTEDLEELRSEKALLLQQFEYAEDAGAETFRKDIAALESNLQKLDEQEQKYSAELETALHEYAEAKLQAFDLDPVELYEARA